MMGTAYINPFFCLEQRDFYPLTGGSGRLDSSVGKKHARSICPLVVVILAIFAAS